MRIRIVCLSLFLLAHVPSIAHGQGLGAGDAIRVRAPQSTGQGSSWTEGTVVRLAPDTLWYRSSGSVLPMSLGNAQIQRSSLRDHRWGGTRLGGLVGGLTGGLVGHLRFEPELVDAICNTLDARVRARCPEFRQVNSGLTASIKSAAVGIAVGGVVGFVLGKKAGRWETVEVDRLSATDGTFSLSLRIRR